MKRTFWIVLGLLAVLSNAEGVSFDCAKSATRVEKLICSDAELSRLDDELSAAYKTALQENNQADVVHEKQKLWINERNGCANAICVKSVYEERIKVLSVSNQRASIVEEKIQSVDVEYKQIVADGPYIVLQCRGSVFNFILNWRVPVGTLHERRRHLFYHIWGDFHVLLPVLDSSGLSTGYVNQTKKARALAYEILSKEDHDLIPIGVFPAGSDPSNGEWVDAFFPLAQFAKSMSLIGKACNFDPSLPIKNVLDVDMIPPAAVGSGED